MLTRIGRLFTTAAILGMIGVAGASCARSPLDATAIPLEEKEAFEIKEGMSRDRVESVLGFPTSLSPTKDGDIYAHYVLEGTNIRSVVYDDNGRVVVAYP